MNKISLIVFSIFLVLNACGTKSGDTFGRGPVNGEAMSPDDALKGLGTSPRSCKVEGVVTSVCQAEGCWFKVQATNGKELMIRTRDHSLRVPKDLSGLKVIIEGELTFDTTSVEMLRDFAKDAGKSQTEIDAIVQPEISEVMFASGVTVR
ncbi:MAG: DUF4920 domain-containing protein [Bacteroidota bacterium]